MKITRLLTVSEEECREIITDTLSNMPHEVTEGYIVTRNPGVLPLICVHTDVHGAVSPPAVAVINGVVVSAGDTKCLGADDRAGVWIALEMIKRGRVDFNYAFFSGEETGCIGSHTFSLIEDLSNYSCFIGLDKSGYDDVATYGYDSDELIGIFEDIGYVRVPGTVSDCSVLSAASGTIPCVNLSVGYTNEHTKKERLNIKVMEGTLEDILEVTLGTNYEISDYEVSSYKSCEELRCDCCWAHVKLYDTHDGYYLCSNCL